MTSDDLTGLGDGTGKFGRRIKVLSCGRVAYEFRGSRWDVIVLPPEKRREVYLWLATGAPQPAWWPGWPGQ